MRLTAYTCAGPWRTWDGVDTWALVDGDRLILRRDGSDDVESTRLPREVVGLADDGPIVHHSETPPPREHRASEREQPFTHSAHPRSRRP